MNLHKPVFTLSSLLKFSVMFFILLIATQQLCADSITIVLKKPLENVLGVNHMWEMDITNSTEQNINIYITGTVTEAIKGPIVSAKTKVLTIVPGTKQYGYNDFNGSDLDWKDKPTHDAFTATGSVPNGEYTICVMAYYEDGKAVGKEICIPQIIDKPKEPVITVEEVTEKKVVSGKHLFRLPVETIVYDADSNIVALVLKTKDGKLNLFEAESYQPGIPSWGDDVDCWTVYCNNPSHPTGCGWRECKSK